jgi:hypothetical protein
VLRSDQKSIEPVETPHHRISPYPILTVKNPADDIARC